MAQVTRTQTPVSVIDFTQAMADSMQRLGYGTPTQAAVAVAWSHFALETGYGQYCWNYNLGNHRWYGPTETPDYVVLAAAWECGDSVPDGATAAPEHDAGCSGSQVAYYPNASGQQFAAFPTLSAGMDAYLTFLHDHYPESFAAMLAGDVAGFSHGLKQRGYYTADEGAYTAKLQSIYASALPTVPAISATAGAGLGLFAVFAAAAVILWYRKHHSRKVVA